MYWMCPFIIFSFCALSKKLKKIEENIAENNKRLEELRESYVTSLTTFSQKQEERNACSRNRRAEEKNHLQIIEKTTNNLNDIDKNICMINLYISFSVSFYSAADSA